MLMSDIVKLEGLLLIRIRKETHDPGSNWNYDVKEDWTQGKKRGWFYLDAFTLSALKAVYNALSQEHQEKFNRIHITRLINFAWDQIRKSGA